MVVALLYWIYISGFVHNIKKYTFWKWAVGVIVVFVPVLIYFYNNNQMIYENFRFGFEGFFSLWETGKWEVSSNDILKNMVVFPDNLRTWIIGDGYAVNPSDIHSPYFDPNYVGESYHGYYMETDIGYLRYIFYFGLAGLGMFIAFFCVAAQVCIKRFPAYRILFLMFLLLNFIGWFKVSTDIFLVFALFLCISKEENVAYSEYVALKE